MLMCLRLKVGRMNSALLQRVAGRTLKRKKQMTLRHTQEKKEVKSLLPTQLPKLDPKKRTLDPVFFSLLQMQRGQWYLVGMSGFQKVASG